MGMSLSSRKKKVSRNSFQKKLVLENELRHSFTQLTFFEPTPTKIKSTPPREELTPRLLELTPEWLEEKND